MTEHIEIKSLEIDFYDEIISLWKKDINIRLSEADSKPNILRFIQRNPETCFVIIGNKKVVGTILCGHDGRRGYFHHLYLDEAYRSKGLGKKLVDMSIAKLKEMGIGKVHFFVAPDNINGQMFWEKMGFYKRTEKELFVFSKDIK